MKQKWNRITPLASYSYSFYGSMRAACVASYKISAVSKSSMNHPDSYLAIATNEIVFHANN